MSPNLTLGSVKFGIRDAYVGLGWVIHHGEMQLPEKPGFNHGSRVDAGSPWPPSYYYWNLLLTHLLPTYLPSGQGAINFRPRRRLTVSYRFSSCRRRKRVGRVPPERGESNALSETPHAAINSLAATVRPPMNVGYVWNYSNSLVHFCSALLGPENHLSSRSSFFLLFFFLLSPFFSVPIFFWTLTIKLPKLVEFTLTKKKQNFQNFPNFFCRKMARSRQWKKTLSPWFWSGLLCPLVCIRLWPSCSFFFWVLAMYNQKIILESLKCQKQVLLIYFQ